MQHQYSDSIERPDALAAALALDTGSERMSVAASLSGEVCAEEVAGAEQSSSQLLEMTDRVLQRAGIRLPSLNAVAGLRGPGSFTGLRVGLATLQGWHQCLGLPVATLPTLSVLASLSPSGGDSVSACVDALRDEWWVQRFSPGLPPRPLEPPWLCSTRDLASLAPGDLIGFGLARLQDGLAAVEGLRLIEPRGLAAPALRLLATDVADWRPESLSTPYYLRPPAAVRADRRPTPVIS